MFCCNFYICCSILPSCYWSYLYISTWINEIIMKRFCLFFGFYPDNQELNFHRNDEIVNHVSTNRRTKLMTNKTNFHLLDWNRFPIWCTIILTIALTCNCSSTWQVTQHQNREMLQYFRSLLEIFLMKKKCKKITRKNTWILYRVILFLAHVSNEIVLMPIANLFRYVHRNNFFFYFRNEISRMLFNFITGRLINLNWSRCCEI